MNDSLQKNLQAKVQKGMWQHMLKWSAVLSAD